MTEQRYGYTYHRVLIDSARVLDPQFDDAVIYVTGAQLELLRNMTQYLNRLSTYVSEYHPDYYLSPPIEDYDSICAIVADLEETLMGNDNVIWGFNSQFAELIPVTSTGEAWTDASSTPVPEGFVFSLERWQHVQLDDQARAIMLNAIGDSVTMLLDNAPNQEEGVFEYGHEPITLVAGDYIRLRVYTLANTKECRLYVWGTMMQVPA